MEQTLVILKPDALQRGIAGEIITRFERIGLKIVAAKMVVATDELANKHYPVSRKELIDGIGHKTLENYKEQGLDPIKGLGTDNAHEIGLLVQKWLVEYITDGPVLAFVFEGPHAVELVRKISGHTLPAKSMPGTIRGDYSFDSSALANQGKRPIRNLVHSSGSAEEAEFEVGLWFSESEIHSYDSVHQQHMIK